MKKNWMKRMAAVLGAVFAVYVFCVPVGAVRLAVAVSGHPVAAVTSSLEKGFRGSKSDDGVQAYHLAQPPVDPVTESVLKNWGVRRFGPFCVAYYWGYC